MKKTLLILALASVGVSAQAPVATPSSTLEWTQPAVSPTDAQTYTYKYYLDGAAAGFAMTPITCVASGSDATCSTPFPTVAPGTHTLQLTAANVAGESPKSSPFAFDFVAVPGVPNTIRIRGGGQ